LPVNGSQPEAQSAAAVRPRRRSIRCGDDVPCPRIAPTRGDPGDVHSSSESSSSSRKSKSAECMVPSIRST
jgi:hypothetical protein